MDIGNSINSLENVLRDLIYRVISTDDDAASLGVTEDRIAAWKARLEEEPKRRPGGTVEQRLLYYSEFHDLISIVRKKWDSNFKECFKERKRFDVYADRLNAFRNPDAHSRALLPFEEQLVLGMTGELRQEITLFLSAGAGGDEPEYFARIEDIVDNFGLRLAGSSLGPPSFGTARSAVTLRPGDGVNFRMRAWDPDEQPVKWRVSPPRLGVAFEIGAGLELDWTWQVEERDIGDQAVIAFYITSGRPYSRATSGNDDSAIFVYKVLPRRG